MGSPSPLYKDHLQNLFFKSACDGDLQKVTDILKTKSNVDIRDQQGWTALMLAARHGQKDVVKCLVEAGADVSLVNKSGQTALQIAEFWSHGDCCQLLLESQPEGDVKQSKAVVNFFAGSPLDRQALLRTNKSWLDSAKVAPSTRYILLSNQNVYALPPSSDNKKYTLCKYSYSQVRSILDRGDELTVLLLGSSQECLNGPEEHGQNDHTEEVNPDDERPQCVWFAVDVTTVDASEIEKMNAEAELLGNNLITLMGFDEGQAGILAQAVSMMSWHDRYRFCPTCGSSTVVEDAGYKRRCENQDCRSLRGVHNTSYPRLDPVAIMLVIHPDGNQCLLGRKKMFPKGMFSCLAGFMEPGESIEDAVRREVKEESGIEVGRVRYHSSQPWPMPCQVMIGCHCWATSTDITIDKDELEEARWFSREEVFEAVIHGHRGYTDRGGTGIFVPPKQAIAHQLIKAWATTSANL